MADERYVVLGLAPARTTWFDELARWSTSGTIGIDYAKAVSVAELKSRLASGRPFSAALVDGGVLGLDRDLVALATEHGCQVIVVSSTDRDWSSIGVAAVLEPTFGPTDLAGVLESVAQPIGRVVDVPRIEDDDASPAADFRAPTIAVTGTGGCGQSTLAVAIAQGMAEDPAHRGNVVLADFARHADQAVIHDVGDVIPGIQELVDAHRTRTLPAGEARALTFEIVDRRYHLLLGLRRHVDWTALRPRAVRAAVDTLRRAFSLLVVDVDPDTEDESTCGSADVEDRNRLTHETLAVAGLVVCVGRPGLTGVHALLRLVRACIDAGVDPARIVPVVNRAPRGRRARTEIVGAWSALRSDQLDLVPGPVMIGDRSGLDHALHDGVLLPAGFVRPVVDALAPRLERLESVAPPSSGPVPVSAGTLGTWEDEVAG